MKSVLTIIVAFFCINSIAQNLIIKGKLENNTYDSIALSTFSRQGQLQAKVPMNAQGEFEFRVTIPEMNYFKLGPTQDNFAVLILQPNETVTITGDAKNLISTTKTSGSVNSDLLISANAEMMLNMRKKEQIQSEADLQMKKLEAEEQQYVIDFIKKNKESIACLMLVDKLDKEKHADIYTLLDSSLMAKYPNNSLVNDFHSQVMLMSFLKVGTKVPNIVLKDDQGKEHSIADLKGKYVLIDFWASWCMPCKAEIPNMKRVYEGYKDNGFEIFSVSIDRDKNKWLGASKDLPWINTYDEGGAYAQQFRVASIPFTLFIDTEGKIIAKNLRGNELYTVVAGYIEE